MKYFQLEFKQVSIRTQGQDTLNAQTKPAHTHDTDEELKMSGSFNGWIANSCSSRPSIDEGIGSSGTRQRFPRLPLLNLHHPSSPPPDDNLILFEYGKLLPESVIIRALLAVEAYYQQTSTIMTSQIGQSNTVPITQDAPPNIAPESLNVGNANPSLEKTLQQWNIPSCCAQEKEGVSFSEPK
ncbi:hypothetical protein CPB84DRAFT_1751355 [Gymnopilus junonius]|uniref:Uncharacterized protein n=1 Tax=Gymnopilus junonius TaxID=109634 RepID=A0A9P5NBR7_GYMJU|nr:hypothetical protein CPB84DRAFT_1751355 [Gymnopilus junonius]